ncbi:calpain-1 catalytic subunit [Xyrauchen texanus]|uniref:calpain-1 catalytic subunit n=1 Tax=Xyrauchen texanus TaxID=154827 RepID=UPI002242168C|nr:calpain-1 catalytic subunit [Xyrauchen texanus]
MPPPGVHHYQANEDEMGSANNPLNFLNQDYQELHKQCLTKNNLYIDELFPPNRSSIGTLDKDIEMANNQVQWKRPSDLVSNPCFIVEGISRFDYKQGSKLGNCWFLASIGALTFEQDILFNVIPAGQSFSKDYAGIFHFRFWRFGKWIDVVIDDQLPTIDGQLIFVCSKTSNEFWPALLEKAYAKVCGSYGDLNGGAISEAVMDFTGGAHLYYELRKAPHYLWNIMSNASNSKTLMVCGTYAMKIPEVVLSNGIVGGHVYSVTGVYQVKSKENKVHLVRLLNPWGHGEWNGDWSDKSPLWKTVSVEDRKKCLQVFDNGEFWMAMEDFTKIYEDLDICCLSPDFLDISSGSQWTSQHHFGRWVAGTSVGERFWKNPQFRVRIDECNEEGADNILVSLMQNHEMRHRHAKKDYTIGFFVFGMDAQSGKFSAEFFSNREPLHETFDAMREVMKLFRLEPGKYLIVPCILTPNETASFVLSIFSMHEPHFEYIEDIE